MKNGIHIVLLSFMMLGFLASCKSDKVATSVSDARSAVENSAEAVESKVEEAIDVIENQVDMEEKAIELVNEETAVESIGSKEVTEMKKAEKAEAKKPKVNTGKGTKPDASSKPNASSKPSTNPANNSEAQPDPIKPDPGKVDEVKDGFKDKEQVIEGQVVKPSKPKSVLKEVKEGAKASTGEEREPVGQIIKPSKTTSTSTKIETPSSGINHAPFNTLLSKFVSSSGDVNYAGLKASTRALNGYCKSLTENPPQDGWSKNEKLAFWMNAYNAYTLKLIVDNFPLASITDLYGGKPWDQKWITIGNETLSLNNIENDIIRPRFNDARIHFGVNCAAKSCPPLGNFAFTADNVNSKLNQLTKSFINGSLNQITADKVTVSKIFDWYKSDFGDVVAFINKYAASKANANAQVTYSEYDWSLNGK